MIEYYKESPAKAKDYIEKWSTNLQKESLAECMSMYDELTWYMCEHNDSMKHKYDYNTLTINPQLIAQEPFAPNMVFFDKYMNKFNSVEQNYNFQINKIGFYVGASLILIAIISALAIYTKKRKSNRD